MDDTLPAASADDNHNAINARLHLLRAFLDQLVDSKSIDEKSTLNRYSSSSSSPLSSSSSSSFDLPNIGRTKKHPIGVQSDVPSDPVIYSYPMAGWYGPYLINSPKRAGFLPMRGRKSDPGNQLSMEDHQSPANDFLYTADEPEKRAGFMPMRGKKQTQEISAKRAFHALRG